MENNFDSLIINEVAYIRKDSVLLPAKPADDMEYIIARTYSAGVFAGYLKSREGKECTLVNARRLWSWQGAASLSQLAQSGTSMPDKCKFPEEVSKVILTEVIEILSVTSQAKEKIDMVPVWKQ